MMRNTSRHTKTSRCTRRPILRVVAGLAWVVCLGAALCSVTWAQTGGATEDAIRLAPTVGESVSTPELAGAGSGPVQLSVLDVLTRLALLVLAVYGVAWGINLARRSGLRIGRTALTSQNVRLRECERLALSPAVALHVIEIDHRPVLIASSTGGEVSLLLDLREPTTPSQTQAEASRPGLPAPPASAERLSFSIRDDAEWQERRDALIRSLARGG